MSTVQVSLPDSVREFLEAQVAEGGYQTTDEYVHALIQDAQLRKAREEVEALLLEGLQSEASPMTREDWDELKRRVWERHAQRGGQ